ncbi:MAG: tetratricopeptide repeat protein, partial [Peptostreptococcaceae bacterium]
KNQESLIPEKIEDKKEEPKKNKKNMAPYVVIGCLVLAIGVYHIKNKARIDDLTSELSNKEDKLNEADQKLSEADQKLDETNKKLDETNQKLDETNGVLDETKMKKELATLDEVSLYNKALSLKKSGNTDEAIQYYEAVIKNAKTAKYKSTAIYEVAYLYDKEKKYDEAIKYYKMYINTYTSKENYYDDSFYQLGMAYYAKGDLAKAKETFYGLRSELPDSIYNNSNVTEILKK